MPPLTRFFEDASEFRAWLEEHHATASELMVGFRKVASGVPSITWPESVDEALCFGWIDGVRRRVDEISYQPVAKVIRAADEQNGRFLRRRNSLVSLRILLRCVSSNSAILLILAVQSTSATGCYVIRFTPRRPDSVWSEVNLAKARALIAARRMHPAGLAAYKARGEKRTGLYSFEQKGPIELQPAEVREFRSNKAAWKFCESQPPSYRKTITHWVVSAKRSTTRARRCAQLIVACAEGRRLPR